MKKRNKAILTGASLLMVGTVTGYAATNILGNLDTIKENYNITFDFAKTQKQKAEQLQRQLDNESNSKEQLQNEINQLKTDIENIETNHTTNIKNIETNHAIEITNKNAEITNKQNEITAKQKEISDKQAEVDEKQASINRLNTELGQVSGELNAANVKVTDLLNHTNNGVQELTGGK